MSLLHNLHFLLLLIRALIIIEIIVVHFATDKQTRQQQRKLVSGFTGAHFRKWNELSC